ncbi:SAC3/GANP [Gracilaria domingensis]|nr:SAC3/GANP [Gracilaria domingensis]
MESRRTGRRENSSWFSGNHHASGSVYDEEAEDPFADDIAPAYTQGWRGERRPQQGSNAFSWPNPPETAPQDVFDSLRFEDPFVEARARNRAQVASSNPWQTASAPVSAAPNSFASHLFQSINSGAANTFPAAAPQDVFQTNATDFAPQEATDFASTPVGAGFSSPNMSDSSKPPKYPFRNHRGQPASSSETPQINHGLAPRKQFTPLGNAAETDEVEEWSAQREEHATRRSGRGIDADRKNKAPEFHGDLVSLFIRSVPVALFSTRAVTEHFERLPVTVTNVSLRGSKQMDSNRTAVVTFESERQASVAHKRGRRYNGTQLDIQFYEPYGAKKPKQSHELKPSKEPTARVLCSYVPRRIRTGWQMKRLLEKYSDSISLVELAEHRVPGGTQMIAIVTFWSEGAAEAMVRRQPRYGNKILPLSYLEEEKHEFGSTARKIEPEESPVRKAFPKEAKQMTEQERLREMEQLRREIAIIEEKKRQQEFREEQKRLQKQKHTSSSREPHERLQSNTDQRKVDARLSKYGSQKAFTELPKANESKGEHWRKVGQKMDIQDAKQFVGVCLDMCPLSEFESRVEQRDISPFELISGPGSEPDSRKAVKKYRRSAAISEEQKPEEVRPPDVLARTMDHLKKVCDSKQAEFYEIHNFVRDRTRSIRQDFTLQGVRDDCCIKIHEESVRFHIMSEHRLFGTNPARFSSKQNLEQLDKCLISLREMYDLRREQNLQTSPNEPEMQAYYILTQMSDPQTCVQLWTGFAKDVRRSRPVRFALEVVKAAGGQFANPVKFFSCVQRAPYLTACLMHSRFTPMRVQALRLLNSTYGSTSSRDEIAIDTLAKQLCFEDEQEARQFCELLGFEVLSSIREEASQEVIAPPCRDFDTTRASLFKSKRSDKVIEPKACQLSPSEIIDGAAHHAFMDESQDAGNASRVSEKITHSEDSKIQEEVSNRRDHVLGVNTPTKEDIFMRVSNAGTKASEINTQASAEQHQLFETQVPGKGEGGSSLRLFAIRIDPGKQSELVPERPQGRSSGEPTLPSNRLTKPTLPANLVESGNLSPAVHPNDKQSTTGSKTEIFKEPFSVSPKPVQAATSIDIAPSAQVPRRNGNESAWGVLRNLTANANVFTLGNDQGIGKLSSVTERRLSGSEPQTVGINNNEVPQRRGKDISVNRAVEIALEADGHERIRERASRLVEERQRIVAIAKKARKIRYKERCDKVLLDFGRYTKYVEESLEEAFAVLRSLSTGGMKRSDTLNAAHAGFEHLDRALARITRAEEFLEEAKRWAWEGQEFPEQPFTILRSFREKGRSAWEEMSECRKTALLESPEPPEVEEHGKKFFWANKKYGADPKSPLEMSMKTVTDRIPILSLPRDDSIPSPGMEVANVFRTLRKLDVLHWQAVIVSEKQGQYGANGITTTWLRSRLGKSITENGMVIDAKNKEVVKYPCLSVLRVDNDDDLPVTASTIIWSVDGSRGESGLHEEQKLIERRLSALQSHSQTVPRAPPFLILVCFNAMGPMSRDLKEELEEGGDSEWAQSLLTKHLVCGTRSVVLSKDAVLQRRQDFQLLEYLQESVVTYQSRVAAHGLDLQLQRVSDILVEVGNNAWMEFLDQQLIGGHRSTSNELCDVIRLVNENWHRVAKSVSNNARRWPTEFSHHRVHFVRVGAELIRRMRLPIPSENDEHSCARYLRLLCTSAGIAFPKIQHHGFQGFVEFCRTLGVIMPRIVASLLQNLKDVVVPLLRSVREEGQEKGQASRVRRLNVLFTSVFGGGGNCYSSDGGNRSRKDSSLGKRHRDGGNGENVFYQEGLGSPMQKRRLSLNEEYRGSGETPNRRFSLPWKTFGNRRWSERYEFIVAEAEAFGEEINATIDLVCKRRKVAPTEPERHLVVSD